MVFTRSIGMICSSCAEAAQADKEIFDEIELVDVDELNAQFLVIRVITGIGIKDEAIYLIMQDDHDQIECSWIK